MAENGVRTTEISLGGVLNELVGNADGSTVRVPVSQVALQMIADGPLASELANKPDQAAFEALDARLTVQEMSTDFASILRPTWTSLSALTGAGVGQRAEVSDSDAGTHTDPVVGGTVANAGTYSWSASPAGWQRIGSTGLAGVTTKADNALTYAAALRTKSGTGVFPDVLALAGLTATNLTDAVALNTTLTRFTDRVRIAQSVSSKDVAYSTGFSVGGYRTRIRQTVTNILGFGGPSANAKFGIMLDNGTTKTIFAVAGSSGTIQRKIVGGATTDTNTLGSTWQQNDQIVVDFDILHETGEIIISYSVNGGPRYYAGFEGLSTGDLTVSLYQFSNLTYDHALRVENVPRISKPRAMPDVLSPFAALLRRNTPALWAPPNALPSDFEVYHYDGKFATSYDGYQSPLDETDHAALIYVSEATGLDTNEGTKAAPFRSIQRGLLAARYSTKALVMIAPGNYNTRTLSLGNIDLKCKTAAIVPWGTGRILSSPRFPVTWTLNTGSTYQATLTGVTGSFVSVYDAANLTADGDRSPLTSRGSIALVDANPGSYFLSGSTIYVRTVDSRTPDADLIVFDTFNGTLAHLVPGGTLYVENFDQEGSVRGFNNAPGAPHTQDPTLVLKNVSAKYNTINGVWNYTAGLTVLIGGDYSPNRGDGISYGVIGGAIGVAYHTAIEIGVRAQRNGVTSTDQNSTMHEGGVVVRVNGQYDGQAGQGIADVGGSWSWLLGCTAESGTVTAQAFFAGGTMFLDTCTALGGDVDIVADTGRTVYTSGFTGTGTQTGTVASYTP